MTSDGPEKGPTTQGLRDRLQQFTIPISGDNAAADPETRRMLTEVFDDKLIVGLGESSHGTRELSEAKQNLIRFLVTEVDVRSITFEASLAGMAACNRYVVYGEGTVGEVLDGLYNHYCTESFKSLIEWLRTFNSGKSRDDRVQVYGIDIDSTAAVAELQEFLAVVDPGYAEPLRDDFDVARRARWADEQEVLSSVRSLVEELRERFEDHAGEYADRTSPAKVKLAEQYVREFESTVEWRNTDLHGEHDEGFAARDEAMADNLRWVRDQTDVNRLIVWADNIHLTYDTERDRPYLGDHLRECFGDDYYALAVDFGKHAPPSEARGALRDQLEAEIGEIDPNETFLEPVITASDTFEDTTAAPLHEVLTGLESEPVLLDFDRAGDDSVVRRWLDEPHLFHSGTPVPGEDPTTLVRSRTPSASMDGFACVPEGNWPRPLGTDC